MGYERIKTIGERAGDFALAKANELLGIPLDISRSPKLDHLKDDSKVKFDLIFTSDEMSLLKRHSRNPGIYIDTSLFPNLNATVELAFKSTEGTPMRISKAEATHLADALKGSNTYKPDSSDDKLLQAIIRKLQTPQTFKVAE